MKAAVLHSFGHPLQIEDVPAPSPQSDEVLLQIEACGVCHSDLHIIDGDSPNFKAVTKESLIPGHEVVGRVVRKGAQVDHLAVGDRVGVAWLHASCGECEQCREGLENLCRKGIVTGLMVDGGYAEFMCAKASHALPIPDAVSSVEAAPLFCAGLTVYRALKNAHVRPHQRVGVVGVGGLGHLAVQIAKAFEAEVVALDVADDKLELARALGAAMQVNAADEDAVKALRKQGGVHVAVVTSAAKVAYDTALKCLRPAGTLAVVGLPPEPLTFPARSLVAAEARIIGTAVGTRADQREVLALAAAGRIRCRTETRPLGAVNDVFEQMRRGEITGRIVLTNETGG